MRELLAAFVSSYERRSRGVTEKRRTHAVQAFSAVLFATLAVWAASRPLVLLLFASEALGQALLALDGSRSREDVVVYFRRSAVGLAAAVVFLGATIARALLTLEIAARPTWEIGVLACLVVLHLSQLSGRGHRDWGIGAALAGSALMLAGALFDQGQSLAALSQLAYAGLLVSGALTLRPSVAEALNLAVFSSALTLVP